MLEETTRELMLSMKLKGMLAEREAQGQMPSQYATMSFSDRFGLLLQAEYDLKHSNKVNSLHSKAHFSQKEACVEGILYEADRELSKDQILTLASCSYVAKSENVMVLGPSDTGKSYISCALGNAACRRTIKTLYYRLQNLFEDLEVAEKTGGYLKAFNAIAKTPLLILDDFLLQIPTVKQVQILLELVERREFNGSTIVCSQIHPSQWEARIDEKIQANAIYSRLVPGAHWIEVKGDVPMRERIRAAKL